MADEILSPLQFDRLIDILVDLGNDQTNALQRIGRDLEYRLENIAHEIERIANLLERQGGPGCED